MSLADFLQITPPPPRARSITPVHSFDDSMVDYLSAEVLLQQAFSIRAEVSLIRTEGRFGQKEGGSKARWGIRCTIRLTRNGSKKCLCHSGLSNPSPLSSSNGGRDIGRFGLKSDVVHRAFVCVGLFRGFSRFSQRKSCTRRPCRWHGAQLRARRVFKSKQMVCSHEAGRSQNVVKLNQSKTPHHQNRKRRPYRLRDSRTRSPPSNPSLRLWSPSHTPATYPLRTLEQPRI